MADKQTVQQYVASLSREDVEAILLDLWAWVCGPGDMSHYRDSVYCNLKEGEETPMSKLCDLYR